MTNREAEEFLDNLFSRVVELQGKRTLKKESLIQACVIAKKMEQVFGIAPDVRIDTFMDSIYVDINVTEIRLDSDAVCAFRELLRLAYCLDIEGDEDEGTIRVRIPVVEVFDIGPPEDPDALNAEIHRLFGDAFDDV